jgi:hypothetical protein
MVGVGVDGGVAVIVGVAVGVVEVAVGLGVLPGTGVSGVDDEAGV